MPSLLRITSHYLGLLCCALVISTSARADDETRHYFRTDIEVGSEALFNPASVVLNLGFDITRSNTYDNRLLNIDLQTGFSNTMYNIAHPFDAIERNGGFREFIAHEVFPLEGMTAKYSQWVPNYFLHLLGEGMLYRKLSEWYAHEGYAAPKLWAMTTMMAGALMNESVENGSYRGGNTDPIADFYIFNPLGWLLFSDDNVAEFFSETIEIGYWPGQPALVISGLGLYNAGESYFFRYDPGTKGGTRIIGYIGTEGMGGVTLGSKSGTAVSFAAGYRTAEIIPIEQNGARIVVASKKHSNLVMATFWEQDSSLLASLKIDLGFDPALRANIYPGVLPTGKIPVGLFVWASRSGGLVSGINIGHLPLGLAASIDPPIGL